MNDKFIDLDINLDFNNHTYQKAVPYIVTVCSGKGGVGKSVLVSNIAYSLAQENLSVLIWDADKYFPNQHFLLGVEPPARLSEVYSGMISLKNAVFPITTNLSLLADTPATGTNFFHDRNEIIECYKQIINDTDFDIVLIDTPAGASYEVFECCNISDLTAIVITDEPTSLLDAYALIKIIKQQNDIDKISLLVNNVIDWEDAEDISKKLNLATEKFLGVAFDVLGFVPYDRTVRQSILSQELFIIDNYDSEVSKAIRLVAGNILKRINLYDLNDKKLSK
jgi:flagellar biosynthesis protein FlhG